MTSVYFFCHPHGPPDRAAYEHNIVCLAEGLRMLGIPFSGNVDYWQEGNSPGDFLIRQDPDRNFRDADIVVFSSVVYNYELTTLLPSDLFSPKRRYRLVFIDESDGLRTPGFRDEMRACDQVLKVHYNRKYPLPANFRPWAFALSTRIIDQLVANDSPSRAPEILVNYRNAHSLRQRATKQVLSLLTDVLEENRTTDSFDADALTEKDRLLWAQTGRRHYPAYYRRLLACEACSCFGGQLGNRLDDHDGRLWSLVRKVARRLPLVRNDRVYQFDSWRFWESLAAGTCAFQVDLEEYGCVLPVMPGNMEHYLGFDLEDPERVTDAIHADRTLLRRVGDAGRKWALAHYSPQAVGERFLALTV